MSEQKILLPNVEIKDIKETSKFIIENNGVLNRSTVESLNENLDYNKLKNSMGEKTVTLMSINNPYFEDNVFTMEMDSTLIEELMEKYNINFLQDNFLLILNDNISYQFSLGRFYTEDLLSKGLAYMDEESKFGIAIFDNLLAIMLDSDMIVKNITIKKIVVQNKIPQRLIDNSIGKTQNCAVSQDNSINTLELNLHSITNKNVFITINNKEYQTIIETYYINSLGKVIVIGDINNFPDSDSSVWHGELPILLFEIKDAYPFTFVVVSPEKQKEITSFTISYQQHTDANKKLYISTLDIQNSSTMDASSELSTIDNYLKQGYDVRLHSETGPRVLSAYGDTKYGEFSNLIIANGDIISIYNLGMMGTLPKRTPNNLIPVKDLFITRSDDRYRIAGDLITPSLIDENKIYLPINLTQWSNIMCTINGYGNINFIPSLPRFIYDNTDGISPTEQTTLIAISNNIIKITFTDVQFILNLTE